MDQPARDSLEGILLAQGVISQEQFDKIRLEMVSQGVGAERLILDHNYASLSVVAKARAELFGVEFVDVLQVGVQPEALGAIPVAVAKQYQVLPVSLDKTEKVLAVAMADPTDLATVDFLQSKSGYKVKTLMALPEDLKLAVDQKYGE